MKHLVFACLFCLSITVNAQDVQVDSLGYETFSYQEGDTTYVMKKYFMAFLKKGPNRTQEGLEKEKIQTEHLAHMEKLAKEGKIDIAGPFASHGDIQGMVIYSVPTLAEAKEITSKDPAVLAGRLIIEVHPFWAAKGSTLK